MYGKATISLEDRDGTGEKYWMMVEGKKTVYYYQLPEIEEIMQKLYADGEGKDE